MRVDLSAIAGVQLHGAVVHSDERGSFTKLFETTTAPPHAQQVCRSVNDRAGTIRGLHLQLDPHPERKLIWCTAGAIWDVVVDARPDQPTFGSWACVELNASPGQTIEVPPGVLHGFQTLLDATVVHYVIDGVHEPSSARTIAWDDPTLGISWPMPPSALSAADSRGASWPLS